MASDTPTAMLIGAHHPTAKRWPDVDRRERGYRPWTRLGHFLTGRVLHAEGARPVRAGSGPGMSRRV